MALAHDALQQYRSTQVQTASQEQLLLMLYEGAIRFLNRARGALAGGRNDEASRFLQRGQDIIGELMVSLDFEAGEIAGNLYSLYAFMQERLVLAQLRRDPELVDGVVAILTDLRQAWSGAIRTVKGGMAVAGDSGR